MQINSLVGVVTAQSQVVHVLRKNPHEADEGGKMGLSLTPAGPTGFEAISMAL